MTAWKRTERAGAALLDAARAPPAAPDPTDPNDEPTKETRLHDRHR